MRKNFCCLILRGGDEARRWEALQSAVYPHRGVGPRSTPTLCIWEVKKKGQPLPPLLPPLFAILGHEPANVGRTQTNQQKARGVRKFFIHTQVKMGKTTPCNSFSNKLLGLECHPPLRIAPCKFITFFYWLTINFFFLGATAISWGGR